MAGLWSAIASLIEAIANLGAGAASSGVAYEPIVPDELSKLGTKKAPGRAGGLSHDRPCR